MNRPTRTVPGTQNELACGRGGRGFEPHRSPSREKRRLAGSFRIVRLSARRPSSPMYHFDVPLGRLAPAHGGGPPLLVGGGCVFREPPAPQTLSVSASPGRLSCPRTKLRPTHSSGSQRQQRRAGSCSGVGGGPRDEDRRLAPALAIDLAALGRDRATPRVAAVTEHGTPRRDVHGPSLCAMEAIGDLFRPQARRQGEAGGVPARRGARARAAASRLVSHARAVTPGDRNVAVGVVRSEAVQIARSAVSAPSGTMPAPTQRSAAD
jgi:hypothetical protein